MPRSDSLSIRQSKPYDQTAEEESIAHRHVAAGAVRKSRACFCVTRPKPPAAAASTWGYAGAYGLLADERGYEVHLVGRCSARLGASRTPGIFQRFEHRLAYVHGSAMSALFPVRRTAPTWCSTRPALPLGTDGDRHQAISEALRVLTSCAGGHCLAGISEGGRRPRLFLSREFSRSGPSRRSLKRGSRRWSITTNQPHRLDYSTTAYFNTPGNAQEVAGAASRCEGRME